VRFPDDEDLKGAAVALMRLQDVYKLETRDIASGNIQGRKSSGELEGKPHHSFILLNLTLDICDGYFLAHDCFELGRIAYNDRDYYHTLMWMQEALNRLPHETPPTAVEADILEYLAFALYQQGFL